MARISASAKVPSPYLASADLSMALAHSFFPSRKYTYARKEPPCPFLGWARDEESAGEASAREQRRKEDRPPEATTGKICLVKSPTVEPLSVRCSCPPLGESGRASPAPVTEPQGCLYGVDYLSSQRDLEKTGCQRSTRTRKSYWICIRCERAFCLALYTHLSRLVLIHDGGKKMGS